ncbi:hypothetical protein [Oxynema aestuarii]|jgi:hypothetical protein|uniref:Uncharacterized protein n=1 Tax=Oxynema aestuarii AP17 TaxID=2064643 RepID=A0A6H1TST0_9CYAN|nr:hypothetical protein [Oxynema aestuarii]QIZ69654.1 hypothetical protein HCG48_02875 [Oxynema aestuarii AP17]RMH76637.1 MAG: hypothetical protein D6680_07850 [Cyanobacteria bacterium J007]
MFYLFIGAAIAATIATYCYSHTCEEIPRILALTILAISVLLELILAPWPIQLAIAILLLLTNRHLPVNSQYHA